MKRQLERVEIEYAKYSKLSGLAKMQAADGLMCQMVELSRVLLTEIEELKGKANAN